ncbi:MAG TPA: universal stress protein [Ramlibacter sp.]|uniref:universal stress protein n=1 Tax=Ramlibacter sp. TaxID=1917967 RepID=UPI002D1D2063|nr:universal stress protein [Ramlibacter sp.]HVZ43713.1 universal stress protein [Ramlibacter sp.]
MNLTDSVVFRRILVAVDGSATSDHALATAVAMAKAFSAELRVVHVLEAMTYLSGFDTGSALAAAMRRAGDELVTAALEVARDSGVKADAMVYERIGPLGETVAHAAKLWGADLVVVGTHGRQGVTRLLLGSGAEQVIRLAPVPVMVVRSDQA